MPAASAMAASVQWVAWCGGCGGGQSHDPDDLWPSGVHPRGTALVARQPIDPGGCSCQRQTQVLARPPKSARSRI